MYLSWSGRLACTRFRNSSHASWSWPTRTRSRTHTCPASTLFAMSDGGASFLITMRISFESTLISLLACPNNRSSERSAGGSAASLLLVRVTLLSSIANRYSLWSAHQGHGQRGSEQFERAAAVGLGATAVTVGLGHGATVVADLVGGCQDTTPSPLEACWWAEVAGPFSVTPEGYPCNRVGEAAQRKSPQIQSINARFTASGRSEEESGPQEQ